tara:strand:- start:889 stop:2163 length:1275 start_codon:yes stop_codon:yes gene_type:complete
MAYHVKKKKTKKAVVGAATAALGLAKGVSGLVGAARARKAARKFDKSQLRRRVSDATRQMAEEPISQSYIENLQQQQASDRASAMGALSKDPRNILAGVQALESSARKQRTDLLGLQDDARRRAMANLASEQRAVEDQRLAIKEGKLSALQARRAAAQQNIFGGLEDIASGIGAGAVGDVRQLFGQERRDNLTPEQQALNLKQMNELNRMAEGTDQGLQEGGKIDKDGGVTPGEFDHDTNPIDMVKDGKKIGEATGGELILPPDDVEAIRAALDKDDAESAMELMKKLVAKYDSNVIGEDEEMAQEGGAIPKDKAKQIMDMMNEKSDEVTNVVELPFDEDVSNPAGLFNFMNSQLPFEIKSEDKDIINFVKQYRDFLIRKKEKDQNKPMKFEEETMMFPPPKTQEGGYLSKIKSRIGSYIKSNK